MVAWDISIGDGPLVVAAIHCGHEVRPEIQAFLAVNRADRLREEDPFTDGWTAIAPSRIVGLRSRFEVDLNRPRKKAVYRLPDESWGLQIWEPPLPADEVKKSLRQYDTFYREVEDVLQGLVDRHGRIVVYDLHSYNHRRAGPDAEPANASDNPDVNLGTSTMDRQFWGPVVERYIQALHEFDFLGRHLDVRENVKFMGGEFGKRIHERFPRSVCVLSSEIKKFFMDEWSGEMDSMQFDAMKRAIASTVPEVLRELQKL